jgi:hypothetical protein
MSGDGELLRRERRYLDLCTAACCRLGAIEHARRRILAEVVLAAVRTDVGRQGETIDLDGSPVPFIGREAFVRNKLASGRPKDLVDARRLKP